MGVLSGKDLLSAKYVTALISDSEDRINFVPIKITLGDFFLATLNKNIYAFTLHKARILTYRESMVRSFRVIEYDTVHFSSLKHETKELEQMLKKNMLPRMNMLMFHALKILGRKEKIQEQKELKRIKDQFKETPDKPFEPHDIAALIAEIVKNKKKYPEEAENLENYLKSLDIEKIVTPVRKITEFIEDDLIATSSSFLGELVPRYERLDNESKRMSNKAISGSKAWMKVLLVAMMIGFVIFIAYFAYTQGWFSFITNAIPSGDQFKGIGEALRPDLSGHSGGGNPYSDTNLQAQYTPEQLRAAVDRGDVPLEKLSPTMKKLIANVKLPQVVELTP